MVLVAYGPKLEKGVGRVLLEKVDALTASFPAL
jgi:hypothetical protein